MWDRKEFQPLINTLFDLLTPRIWDLAYRNRNDPINSYFNRYDSNVTAFDVVKLIPFRDLNFKGFSTSRIWTGFGKVHL